MIHGFCSIVMVGEICISTILQSTCSITSTASLAPAEYTAVAGFIDYLVEATKWSREGGDLDSLTIEFGLTERNGPAGALAGPVLVELIRIYPKVLAGGANSQDPVVAVLAQRLGRRAGARQSQRVHIAAINHYLALSEDFVLRMQQSGLSEVNGLPLIPQGQLFPQIGESYELSRFERFAMSSRSMLAGVTAGGPKLKRLAGLTPVVVDDDDDEHFDYDSAFPLESAPDLIKTGFLSHRDKALYCLLMASGIRISEALALTWHDIDCVNRKVFVRNPRAKHLDNVYLGYFTVEERRKLPWKGRTHSQTLLIESFATEFWKQLGFYMEKESLVVGDHPFVFQDLKGSNVGSPLLLSDHSNLRKSFKDACARCGIDDCYSPHSLRHMYGVYCLNYWPKGDGTYGLPPDTVQQLMGHAYRDSTMNYAKLDILILEAEQKINAAIMSSFQVEDRAETRVKVLAQMLAAATAETDRRKQLPTSEKSVA